LKNFGLRWLAAAFKAQASLRIPKGFDKSNPYKLFTWQIE
jgi:hypothetical protein